MPDLMRTLQGHDLGFLKIVASLWGLDIHAPDAAAALPELMRGMCDAALAAELIETLPLSARSALQALMRQDGAIPAAEFSRRFGEVRVMGAGKRDRERPDLNPSSPAEILWYRGFIGKAFLNRGTEPAEYVYIPEEMTEFMPAAGLSAAIDYGRPATPGEFGDPQPANDRILDHLCTFLAARRCGIELNPQDTANWQINIPFLEALTQAAGLVSPAGALEPEKIRHFLEAPRGTALTALVKAWLDSNRLNELRLLPGLKFEGSWQNDPFAARHTVLELLHLLPPDTWWNLNAFINAVHDRKPDFQRPAGDYDSWFIRDEHTQTYLRGFGAWDAVDGALIRFIITGPLHWLGLLDLAGKDTLAFRPSRWAAALWAGKPPEEMPREKEPIRVTSSGRLLLNRLTPRSIRYQIARFCAWEPESFDEYRFHLTPAALDRAKQQGLKSSQLLKLLQRFSAGPLPPGLQQALERWDKFGNQTSLENVTVLKLASPEIIDSLRKTKAARFIGAVLNPTTVVVKPGGEEIVRSALMEIGYLLEFQAPSPEKASLPGKS